MIGYALMFKTLDKETEEITIVPKLRARLMPKDMWVDWYDLTTYSSCYRIKFL